MSTPAGQRDAKIFAHIYYSGDAAIIDDRLEIRLVDGQYFDLETYLRTLSCADYTVTWTVFDCSRNYLNLNSHYEESKESENRP